ncbi:MAG TPA: DUF6438 domain-containing protein [Gemmatimonadaceae bacterium]|jgi:hypothetical protein|nr:DUF6438 domain-containing protein [Gemmatimonadaceae bacterium]
MSTVRCGAPILVLAMFGAVAACHNRQEPTTAHARAADSVVLERSRCFGSCPAYRLRIGEDGAVTHVSRDSGDASGTKTDSIARSQVEWLLGEAERIGFYSLPEVIADDSTLCPLRATDHPTATVTIYRDDSAHTVVDYHGCYASHDLAVAPKVQQLRRFEAEIDSIAGVSRWVRPASR